MKTTLLSALLLLATALAAGAAQIKISDLPLSVNPTDNTFIEIADMSATPKSSKYLLTNKVNQSQLVTLSNSVSADFVRKGTIYGNGQTMTAPRLLGRTTAGTGAIEPIAVGAGLTLTGGVLTATGGGGGGTWGSITGTLSDQLDLQAALNSKAPTASPTFTGTVTADIINANELNLDLLQTGTLNVTTNLQLLYLLETNKLAGIGVSSNLLAGTYQMWTNTAGLFNNNTAQFLRADGTMAVPPGAFGGSIWTNDGILTSIIPGLGATVVVGTNASAYWSPDASDAFTAVHDASAGEASRAFLSITSVDGVTATNIGAFWTYGDASAPGANLVLFASTNDTAGVESRFRVNMSPGLNETWMHLVNNGTTIFTVTNNSGWAGGGTKFLSDDGTYKDAAGDFYVTNLYVTNLTVYSESIFHGKVTINTNVYVTNGGSIFIDGTNIAKINPTDNTIPYRVNTNTFWDSPLTVSGTSVRTGGNLLVAMTAGATNYFDLNFATQTNNVTAALAFSYGTNGVAGYQGTVLREFLNVSGGDLAVSWPTIASGVNGWRTNPAAALPPAFTNGTWTKILVEFQGPTGTLAEQTNVHVLGVTYN